MFQYHKFWLIRRYICYSVLNYPQAGILGIGRILKTPVVKDDEIIIGNIMPLSLTVDHRIVDGGETTRFIYKVMEYLTDPISFLMGVVYNPY